jgi:hypothetical protein
MNHTSIDLCFSYLYRCTTFSRLTEFLTKLLGGRGRATRVVRGEVVRVVRGERVVGASVDCGAW